LRGKIAGALFFLAKKREALAYETWSRSICVSLRLVLALEGPRMPDEVKPRRLPRWSQAGHRG
jgi:hypothetical protein